MGSSTSEVQIPWCVGKTEKTQNGMDGLDENSTHPRQVRLLIGPDKRACVRKSRRRPNSSTNSRAPARRIGSLFRDIGHYLAAATTSQTDGSAQMAAFSSQQAVLDGDQRRFEEKRTSVLIPGPMTRSSRNRLQAVVDLIFDALPDLVGAHVRSFQ
jgi:hypothetical protein